MPEEGRFDDIIDASGRVHGIGALRVVDASMMPSLPRGNTKLPTIMVAEKLSETIIRQAREDQVA
jgi:5-(hydroxymethyl)furfural/furfural oxidase